ncbi:MAG: aminoacyl-tRNA hydrolase [bacterium]
MKIIVGLGNPGEKYEKTRHNVGFMVVEKLVGEKSWSKSKGAPLMYVHMKMGEEPVEVIKPLTFMNESGQAVMGPLKKHSELSPSDVYVIHDDLDIELGEFKLQFGKGPKVHYGVNSIEKSLGTSDFWRIRVGVENRKIRGNKGVPGEKYSLQNFSKEEEEIVSRVIEQVIDKLMSVVF